MPPEGMFAGSSHGARMLSPEAETMTMRSGTGDPLPGEIEKLAEAEDGILFGSADVSDEEKSEIDSTLSRHATEEQDDAAGDTSPP